MVTSLYNVYEFETDGVTPGVVPLTGIDRATIRDCKVLLLEVNSETGVRKYQATVNYSGDVIAPELANLIYTQVEISKDNAGTTVTTIPKTLDTYRHCNIVPISKTNDVSRYEVFFYEHGIAAVESFNVYVDIIEDPVEGTPITTANVATGRSFITLMEPRESKNAKLVYDLVMISPGGAEATDLHYRPFSTDGLTDGGFVLSGINADTFRDYNVILDSINEAEGTRNYAFFISSQGLGPGTPANEINTFPFVTSGVSSETLGTISLDFNSPKPIQVINISAKNQNYNGELFIVGTGTAATNLHTIDAYDITNAPVTGASLAAVTTASTNRGHDIMPKQASGEVTRSYLVYLYR